MCATYGGESGLAGSTPGLQPKDSYLEEEDEEDDENDDGEEDEDDNDKDDEDEANGDDDKHKQKMLAIVTTLAEGLLSAGR